MAKSTRPLHALPPVILAAAPTSGNLLGSICPALAADIRTLESELDAVRKGGNALNMARAFVALHRVKTVVDAINGKDGGVLPGIMSRFKEIEVPAVFEDAGVPHMSLTEGFRVGISTKIQTSVKGDKKPEAYEWLRANNMGALIVETVNAQTLSAAAKAMVEEYNMEFPDDLFNKNEIHTTSVTGTK